MPNYAEPLSHEEISIRAIYRAILAQVVSDLASKSKKKDAIKAREDAERWIGSGAFIDCCLNAGWTPEGFMRNLKFAQERGYQWRLPAGKGWRVQKRIMEEGVLP